VALAEMAFAGGYGARINLKSVPLGEEITRDDYLLFSESNTRFLVEVAPEDRERFEGVTVGLQRAVIGEVTDTGVVDIYSLSGDRILSAGISELKEAWQKPLRW
jgi:phosphoribosylformylglycinamidine synthase